jgi:1-aminocyclopropane-1-carboxylate deaminase
MDGIATNYFPAESKILLIHTGGFQELKGWIHDYEKKLPIINAHV